MKQIRLYYRLMRLQRRIKKSLLSTSQPDLRDKKGGLLFSYIEKSRIFAPDMCSYRYMAIIREID